MRLPFTILHPLPLAICGLGLLFSASGCSKERTVEEPVPARHPPPGSSGGEAARPFSLAKRDGTWWLVDPAGRPFFSLGVCVVDQGIARDKYDPAKPGYAAWRSYPDSAAWAEAALKRLRSWGFTTVGGWGDSGALKRSPKMDLALTPVLGAGMEAGVPWFDLWDPTVTARVEELARERISAARDLPWLLGYYTDNEMGWWNGALFKMTLEHPARSGQRQRLVKLLHDTYGGAWESLLGDFDPEGAHSFADLEVKGILYLRPGGDGIHAVRRFLELVAERYYELLAGIVRRHDSRALILGDRFQSFYYPEVARAAGRHVDIISTNLNAHWTDGTFARFYLDTLHELSGKPILVSEFYMTATENQSGNPNDHGLFPVVPTQGERATGFLRTLTSLLDLPYVVGADWFQYYDEPPGGRFDGENFNFGLVDIDDRPYEELVAAARSVDAAAAHGRARRKRLDASGGVPPAPPDPFVRFEPNLALEPWDRERGFVRPTSRFPLADLYLSWRPEGLYFGLFAIDAIEEASYRGGQVPEVDRMEWSVEIDGLGEPMKLRIGAGLPPSGVPPGATAVSLSGKKLSVRTVALLSIPAKLQGRAELTAGSTVRLRSTLTMYARAGRVEWEGEFRLSP